MADDRSIRVRLLADIAGYRAAMAQAAGSTKEFGREVSGQGDAARKHIEAVGRSALVMSAGIGIAVGASVKAAIDWESAWAGVTKTVNGSNAEMSELEGQLRGLATSLPASHKEIAGVAEAAGQLGIQRENIAKFTKTMIDLGVSTNLSAEDAATSIAQITNVMGTSQADVDRFGATLVALGNVGASTESDILAMAARLAGAGKLVGASESDVLGLANAMTSMGIQAELGGGAFSRVMLKIYSAVKSGGDKLQGFANIAGKSADQFASDFEADPIRAIDGFVKGLGGIEASGGNVVAALAEVGFKGTQDLQVLLRLKGAGDLLTQSLDLGSKAWQDNVALTNEANKRYETTQSRLRVLRNQIGDVAIDVGGVFTPAIKGATDVLGSMVSGMGHLEGAGRGVVGGVAAATGVLSGLIGVVGVVGPKVRDFKDSLSQMGGMGKFVAGNLGTISSVIGGIGLALGVYSYILGENAKKQAEAAARAAEFADAIKEQGAEVGHATDEMALTKIMAGDLGDAIRDTGVDISGFISGLRLTGPDARQMRTDLEALRDAAHFQGDAVPWKQWREELDRGRLSTVPGLRDTLIDLQESGMGGKDLVTVIDRFLQWNGALADGQTEARNRAEAEKVAADAAEAGGTATQKATKALMDEAKAAQEVTDAIDDYIDAQRRAIDPLFAYEDAARAYSKSLEDLATMQKEGGHTAAELQEAQENTIKSALDLDGASLRLAGSLHSQSGYTDVLKAQVGQLAEQYKLPKGAVDQFTKSIDEWVKSADIAAGDRVLSIDVEGMEGLDALNRKLDETLNKAGMFAAQERENRGSTSTVKATAPVGSGQGYHGAYDRLRGGVDYAFDAGGMTPAHIAVGTRIRYAEPGTGGEAYVPRLGDHSRALGVLSHAAGWHNAAVVRRGDLAGLSAPPASSTTVVNLGGIHVAGSVHSEQSLQRAVEKGVAQGLRRNPGFRGTVKAQLG